MVVKLHVFQLPPDGYEFGHLYSGTNDVEEICSWLEIFPIGLLSASGCGRFGDWMQFENGLHHMDLWGQPLRRAKVLLADEIVNNRQMAEDLRRFKEDVGSVH